MEISQRVQKVSPSATLALSSKANEMKEQGINVINLTTGEPNFPTPKHIGQAAIKAIQDGNSDSYTSALGIKELRLAIAKHTNQQYGTNFKYDNVAVTTGGKFSLYVIGQVLLNPGDEVIIPLPYWVSYGEQVKLSDGVPVFAKSNTGGVKISVDDLERVRTTRTKAVIINTPNNPSGAVYSKQELINIGNWAVEHDIVLICDDMYGQLVYNGTQFTSMLQLSDEIKKQVILVHGLSKSYAMTGWRVGYTVADTKIIKAMNSVISHSTGNISAVSQYAALEALQGNQDDVEQMRQAYEKRLNLIYPEIESIPGFTFDTKPQGAFYLFPNVLQAAKLTGFSDVDNFVSALLEEVHVAVVPGSAFGLEDYMRLSYAASDEDLQQAINRINDFVTNRMN